MFVAVGYSNNPDSAAAGRQAAEIALSKAERSKPCDLVLLFCTARHNQRILRDKVAAVVGNDSNIYGGSTVGVITNDEFGYAGDQVGIALFWFDDSNCTILTENGLHKGEWEAGMRLGKRLAALNTTPSSPVMLFYDAIDRTKGDLRLLMATYLLEGLKNGLTFLPDLTGAGMQGDHVCSPTQQFTGTALSTHSIFSLSFSDDIRIDSAIMHGCHPASPYYTVTKADGSVILEINEKPALQFIDELLESAIDIEDYPFFLLFGINHGDPWGQYDEDAYASRLCLGIDKERSGIVMFEPDMTEGTEFQIMYRSLNLDYMRPKIESVFSQLGDREPLFAMYIDCAGRCAGYGGVDIEDAIVVQEVVGNRVPLLGLYTGVEIASIGGSPRGLDWTGVFCLFSKKCSDEQDTIKQRTPVWNNNLHRDKNAHEVPVDAAIKLCEQNAAKILALDTQSISIRHELEQKRRGFSLLAELSVSLQQQQTDDKDIFLHVTQRINSALNMQRTVVLFPDGSGKYIPQVLQGYPDAERAELTNKHMDISPELLDPEALVIVTAADDETRLADLRSSLKLRYFISAPIIVKDEIVAILITGRMEEAVPFLSRLGRSEMETLQAISALLSSVFVLRRWHEADMHAQTDSLTGLLNRRAFELKVTEYLKDRMPSDNVFVFIIIDLDYFKLVNDTYGHQEGDSVLKALSEILHKNFRANDLVARIGGDEFAAFYSTKDDVNSIKNRITQLMESWSNNTYTTSTGVKLKSTLSVGIAMAPHDGTTYDELFQCADIALYQSKENGRNRYTIYSK